MNNQYAGFLPRLLAYLIDAAILFLPTAVFWWLASPRVANTANLITAALFYLAIILLPSFIISVVFYRSFITARFGGTPGKLLLGLRVADEEGKNISFPLSIFRHVVGYRISGLLWGLGFLWIARDAKKQGWHDQTCGTYVLRGEENKSVRALLILTAVCVVNASLIFAASQSLVGNPGLKQDISGVMDEISQTLKDEPADENSFEEIFDEEMPLSRT